MSVTPTDLGGLRRLRALKTPESEIGAKDKNSEGDERLRKTSGQGLLYADWKCLENSAAASQGSTRCLPPTSS
jgi:hypothetical protein